METNKEALAKIKMSKKNLSLKIADLEEEDNVKKYYNLDGFKISDLKIQVLKR